MQPARASEYKDIYWALGGIGNGALGNVLNLTNCEARQLITFSWCHYFVACRAVRPKENYAIDFSAEEALDYVPVMRTGSGVSGNEVVMPHGRMPLSAVQLPFVQLVDGRRTIREIAGRAARHCSSQVAVADLETLARNVFQNFWRLDLLAMALTPPRLDN